MTDCDAAAVDHDDLRMVVCAAAAFQLGIMPKPDRHPSDIAALWAAIQRVGAAVNIAVMPTGRVN